jgi:undecaprenyl-diphosphatase
MSEPTPSDGGIAEAARSQSLPLSFAAIAAAALAFLYLADEVTEGGTQRIDAAILHAVRDATGGDAATGWLRMTMLDLTALGDTATITLLTILAAGYLLVARRPALAAAVVGAIASGGMVVTLLKLLFARARPDVVTQLAQVSTASFPSGHAANSAVAYLTLGVLLARSQHDHGVRRYMIGAAIALSFAIGVSRVYLGVHWPSDVLGGWIVGGTWAALTGLAVRRFQHQGDKTA